MRYFSVIALCVVSVLWAVGAFAQSGIVPFERDNSEMNRAMVTARATLPAVIGMTMPPNGRASDVLSLKVSVPVDDTEASHEIIWVNTIRRRGTVFSGKLANQPIHFRGKIGDKLRFSSDQIADWSLRAADGRLYGNYTTRVLIKRLPKAEAQQLRRGLTKSPLPPNLR